MGCSCDDRGGGSFLLQSTPGVSDGWTPKAKVLGGGLPQTAEWTGHSGRDPQVPRHGGHAPGLAILGCGAGRRFRRLESACDPSPGGHVHPGASETVATPLPCLRSFVETGPRPHGAPRATFPACSNFRPGFIGVYDTFALHSAGKELHGPVGFIVGACALQDTPLPSVGRPPSP